MKDLNKPRCPVCAAPLDLWATPSEIMFARCARCDWEWSE